MWCRYGPSHREARRQRRQPVLGLQHVSEMYGHSELTIIIRRIAHGPANFIMRRYFFLGLLLIFALLAGQSFADVPMEAIGIKTEATQVGPEVLTKQMEGKKFYS